MAWLWIKASIYRRNHCGVKGDDTNHHLSGPQAEHNLQGDSLPEKDPVHAEDAQLLAVEAAVAERCSAGASPALQHPTSEDR